MAVGHQEHFIRTMPEFKEGDILCSKYQLKKHFDGGGFSSVWLARDLKAGSDFALKIYDDIESMDEFRKNFNLVVNLNHSNIFTPKSYDVHNGVPFLVMSYCQNGSASSRIGNMEEEEIWRFAHDVAAGLAYLHNRRKGIVHQDIKPANILIDNDGKFMITDFDISTRQDPTRRMTENQVKQMQDFNYGSGTPDYMGAERWPDEKENYIPSKTPIRASDIWSFGATLYELMMGITPFGETGGACQKEKCKKLAWWKKNGNAIPPIKKKYSKELRKLVRMCLALRTYERPTAQQIAECSLRHEAPGPKRRWKYAAIFAFVVATISIIYISSKKEKPIEQELTYEDSLYVAKVEEARTIIEDEWLSNRKEDMESSLMTVNNIEKACHLYEEAQKIPVSNDSIRNSGEKQWADAQKLIDRTYQYFHDREAYYADPDLSERPAPADSFANRCTIMKNFISGNIR